MKTHRILVQQLGENATTNPDPVAEVISQDGDNITARFGSGVRTVSLKETKTCCMSADWDMLTEVPKYAVKEFSLPDWMTPHEYLCHQTAWKYYIGFGADPNWPRQWFHRIKDLSEGSKLAVIQLLKVKNFRSNFRRSLREQLEAWLADPNPKYQSPFSRRQWEALVTFRVQIQAKNRASSLYWSR